MANKELTAKIKLDSSDAEAKLKRLETLIKSINKAVTGHSNTSQLESKLSKQLIATEKVKQETLKTKVAQEKLTQEIGKAFIAEEKVNQELIKTELLTKRVQSETSKSAASANKLGSEFKSSNGSANKLLRTVKQLASTYLGIMGMKAVINTSDTITSAENRLNNLEGGNENLTQTSMDKIYAASQRSRSGYGDMLSNVSKTMTLAGDSFQGNIDNAIRFQEIMAKAYTVGGASAAEQSSSMYQLVQALSSGVLQGDELRSVREGAPIAYKKIEEFCQGVLNTEESLKDLASQGVITSDMVVAAIMAAEDEINASFDNTQMTFAQAGNKIKNTAIKAFEPVLQKLNDLLNSDFGKSAIDGICKGIMILAKTVEWVFDVMSAFLNWCAANWEWLKYIVVGVIIVIIALLVKMAAQAILTGLQAAWSFLQAYWPLLLIVAAIMAILYVYELWRQGTISLTEAIVWCMIIIAAACLIAGIILMSIPLLIAALIIAVLVLVLIFFAEICGGVNVAVQFIVNAWYWCGNVICGIWEGIKAVVHNVISGIVNFAMGLWNSLKVVCTNIGIAFENGWIHAKNTFWSFIQSVLEGIRWLEPAINAVAKAFGAEGFTLSGVIDNVAGKQEGTKSYVSVTDAWNAGLNTRGYQNLGEAWDKGFNTYDAFEDGWASDAYSTGYDWGQGIEDKINNWGSQFQNQSGDESGLFTDLEKMLGLDLDNLAGGPIDPNDPAYGVGGGYDPSGANDDIQKALDEINGNTGDIADGMDLTQEDLDYLRRIADMEWKKEFTTATITVDMSNYNTINGENDLDGIVEKLADKLYDEMNAVANGVYA